MSLRVTMLPASAAQPSEAARAVLRQGLRELPRRRQGLVAVRALGTDPGSLPAAWTLRGLRRALDELELPSAPVEALGDRNAVRSQLLRAGLEDAGPAGQAWLSGRLGERKLHLEIPGRGRRAAVPRAWLGRNLILVVPYVHVNNEGSWMGPLSSALAELASALGLSGRAKNRAEDAARLSEELFASVSVLIDATWWSAMRRGRGGDRRPYERLASPADCGHVLVCQGMGQLREWRGLDAWLSELGGLTGSVGASPLVPRVVGKRGRWPRLHLPRDQGSRSQPRLNFGSKRAALGPALHGPFARLWSRSFRPETPSP